MASESEECVDRLLERSNIIDELLAEYEKDPDDIEKLTEKSRLFMKDTEAFIENNVSVIPNYTLKRINDSLKKLERRIDEPNKSKFRFKFNSTSNKPQPVESKTCEESTRNLTEVHRDIFGFKDRKGEELVLKGDVLESKDVSLINLTDCKVEISGFSNTVYIKNLKNVHVEVSIACRAITITDCVDCRFKLVCQQLRINSVHDSEFTIFTSAKSMLESSKGLIIKMLKPDEALQQTDLHQLMHRAKFDWSQNQWKCIQDFDWLSCDKPSTNFSMIQD